jgi:DUF4097 and DUF4098 domain-containing protein YvlB
VTLRTFGILLFLSMAAVPASSAAERVLNQNFAVVGPECSLSVDLYRGGIVVEESDESGIRVSVRLENELDEERESKRVLENVKVDLKQDANGVFVTVRNPIAAAPHFAWRDRADVEVAVLVSVPRRCNLNLVTVTGSIQVGNLAGAMRARAESGTVSVRHIDGSVNAFVAVGDVLVARCSGAVTLVSARGNVRVGTAGGQADLKASNGDIEIQDAKGGLKAEVTAGDAVVGFTRGLTAGADIRTSAGNILVTLDPAVACGVDASSVWGRVETKLPVAADSGASGKNKLTGRINGGGPLLKLRANGGHVRIQPDAALDDTAPGARGG